MNGLSTTPTRSPAIIIPPLPGAPGPGLLARMVWTTEPACDHPHPLSPPAQGPAPWASPRVH